MNRIDPCMFCPVDEDNMVAVWEVTKHCSLKCPHCCSRSGDSFDPSYKDISEEQAVHILELIHRGGYNILYLSGGEPMLWPHLLKIVKKAIDSKIGCYIATSGYSQPPMVLDELLKLPVSAFHVSLDSCQEKEHDAFRGVPGVFKKAVDFIKICKNHRKTVVSSTIISDALIKDISEMLRFLKDTGVDRAVFSFLVPLGRASEHDVVIRTTEEKLHIAECIFREGEKVGIPVTINRIHQGQALLKECPAGKYMVHVNASGEVSPCSWVGKLWSDLARKPQDRLYDEDMLAIMKQRFQSVFGEKCRLCTYADSCGKGCPVIAWLEGEHYDKLCGF